MGSLVEIGRLWDLSEALCARSFLDSQGIFCLIQNEHHVAVTGGYLGVALGGFRIVVSTEDADAASRLLAAAEAGTHKLGDDFDEGAG